MDKAGALEKIRILVERYNQKEASGEIKHFSESQVKKDFIEPLFEALGWNTRDSSEVSAEENIDGKRADYGFRINGITKFYLEAKSPKIDLNNPSFIKQAVNYAYYKSCTWAVLTNFKELRVYNAEIRSNSLLEIELFPTIPFSEYAEKINQLMLLSKESFEQGLTDKEAEKWGKKAKKIPINQQLLEDFTRFRELLSKDITKLNQSKNLSQDNLDEAVQRVLDRLIFIRNCEDRQLEPIELKSNYRTWESKGKGQLINSLRARFKEYDVKYNSELFKEHLCDQIEIDNEALSEVISGLYNTKDMIIPYDFSNIPADVLGNIYEQYLGHILRKTDKRATLKENYVHRKEQGIYYTPTYIVEYIVKNTLGELIKDKKTDLKKIKVLDPACGSGSFLIRAYDHLYDEYKSRIKDSHTDVIKEDILRDNLFGVDLDKQAVEIAQLNLLLKIAQKGHKLPLLRGNIKNGNSLIDDPDIAGDKAFKWEEKFKDIMANGRFDVVIGNPPYVQLSMDGNLSSSSKTYLIDRFGSSMGRLNTFGFFIKLGIDLLKEGGRLGFIIPNTILTQDYYEELRGMILKTCKIESIVNFSELPFKDAVVENVVLIIKKTNSEKERDNNVVKFFGVNEKLLFAKQTEVVQSQFLNNHKKGFNVSLNKESTKLKEKIENGASPLSNFLEINQAIALKENRAKYLSKDRASDQYKKVIDGRNIGRYSLNWDGVYLRYDINAIHSCKKEDIFLTDEKLFFRRVGDRLIATLDDKQFYALNTLIVMNKKSQVKEDVRYFLALFNSNLINYYYQTFLKSTKKVFSEIQARQVKVLPIKNGSETEQQKINTLVDKMLSLSKRLKELGDKLTDERARIEEEIIKTDTEIDNLLYKVYGITDEEKKVIEDSLK